MSKRNWLLFILILLGLLISGYLSYAKLFGTSTICLGGSQSCDLVQNSVYAYLLGIPIAYLGFLTYVVLLFLWLIKITDWQEWGELAVQIFFGITLIGSIFSLYLTYIELFVLYEICQWCVASAFVIWVLLILSGSWLKQDLAS
ncbi:vitamin K epoxide reductase family protein [Chloroflexi bacterium TSY]|nr:vitamin K epoxide reductase family protein [Chloroflexi bacterium TSY]